MNDLRPAKDFACRFGVKCIIYGPPGSGKTPLINTAPRPVLLVTEPGMLSMRNSTVPTFQAFSGKLIDDFFTWFFTSAESKNFDTIAIDSISQLADVYLQEALKGISKSGQKKHGLAAYGEMATNALEHLNALYFTQHKHTYLVAKQEIISENGLTLKRPYFPGKQLPVEMPHKYDEILQLDIQNIPGYGQYKAFRCIGSIDCTARDRTGMLNEFEPPDFSALVKKAMQ